MLLHVSLLQVYRFDKVFDGNSTQVQVYEDVAGLVRSVMDGKQAAILRQAACDSTLRSAWPYIDVAGGCHVLTANTRNLMPRPQVSTCASSPTARRAAARRTP